MRRREGEQSEAGAKGEECAANDLRLASSGEHAEDEQEAEGDPGGDRGEDDEPDVASRGRSAGGRG